MAISEIITLNLVSIKEQFINFSKLRKSRYIGTKITTQDKFFFSKSDIERLMNDTDCLGVDIKLALDDSNKVHVYIEPVYEPGDGPVPGPGVGHGS